MLKFDRFFYEKTYLKKFSSYEEALEDWKQSGGLLGAPLKDNELGFEYTSQLGQDYNLINNIFNRKKNKFFIEFGACDGVFLSNTYILEKFFDWNGLCIEPHPEYFKYLQNNRNCKLSNLLIDDLDNKDVEFSMQENLEVSGIIKYKKNHFYKQNLIKMKTYSLNTVFDINKIPNIIDYLSIDTEGSELSILSTFDFNKYHINYISIEHGSDQAYKQKIKYFLESKNFSLSRNLFWDDEYINNSFID